MNDNEVKRVKDFSGEEVILTLVKKEEYPDKEYDLYTVCKVIKRENEKDELFPLYDETFTKEQVSKFYKNAAYYSPNTINK